MCRGSTLLWMEHDVVGMTTARDLLCLTIQDVVSQRATCFPRSYLDRHTVAALGGDDTVVPVVVDLIVVDRQEVAVVMGVKAVPRVIVHLVPPPVSLLVAERVDPEVVVVYVRVVDVAVDINIFEHFGVALVDAEPTDLLGWWIYWS